MAPKLQAPRGTYDVLPEQAAPRLALETIARRVLEGAGYERIETPVFEATDLFARGVGASTDIVQKEMFSFTDRGERSLTLRPEGTASVCRAFMEHGMHMLPLPAKLWYFGPFFRDERAQAGRFKQFWQIGAETIGSDDPAVDAESICLLHTILTAIGVEGVELRLGSLGTPETRAAYREELVAYLRAHEAELSEEVVARIELNPLRAFDADHEGTRKVMAGAPILMDALAPEDLAHFEEVRARLDAAGVAYRLDPTLVRGLDYYARTLFEFTSDVLGAQSAVGGGGRYDGLIEQLGGKATPACGWAAGVERMLLSAEHRPQPHEVCDLYVAGTGVAAFGLAAEARRAGLNVQLELAGRSRKGQYKQAARLKAGHIALVEDDGTVALEDTVAGTTEAVESAAAAVAHILKGRHL
ncbi:MAG: histidine--tRNA ligase [Solirubrobacterales bacterium]|nr:histidine--tRNA ligase [Solirubrobacterales bacterium]